MRAALPDYVDAWGGEWSPRINGGDLTLPVAAGLRRGLIEGRLTIEERGSSSRLALQVEGGRYRLNWGAVAILSVGAAGGLLLLIWPLYPVLLALAPVAALAAFSAWFLVSARLVNRGPHEFLDGLRHEVESGILDFEGELPPETGETPDDLLK